MNHHAIFFCCSAFYLCEFLLSWVLAGISLYNIAFYVWLLKPLVAQYICSLYMLLSTAWDWMVVMWRAWSWEAVFLLRILGSQVRIYKWAGETWAKISFEDFPFGHPWHSLVYISPFHPCVCACTRVLYTLKRCGLWLLEKCMGVWYACDDSGCTPAGNPRKPEGRLSLTHIAFCGVPRKTVLC